MLGRLLHLGSGGPMTAPIQPSSGSKPVSSLESVQEDIHTRNLLFPDAQTLYQSRNDQVFPLSTTPNGPSGPGPATFDLNQEVDLDVRDVRVIIMQDALGPTNTALLFDSHPLIQNSDMSPSEQESRTMPSSRKGSLAGQGSARPAINAESPPFRQGAFDRRASIHGRSQSHAETEAQRLAREYKEELATFSSCIFGNSELMAYKGTSTKVHVVPVESRPSPDHVFGDGRSSLGRMSARASKLSQSYSSQAISPTHNPHVMPGSGSRHSEKKKVLITRLFPVNLANDEENSSTPQGRFTDENNGFPFPPTGEDTMPKRKKPQPRQRRTPMYAVVLVVQLPASPSRGPSAAPSRSTMRESSSYNEQDFFSSSYSSTKASGWNMTGSGTYGDASESLYSIDVEDRIDSLTQHWDIVMRTLTHLQSVVATTIHGLLKQVDVLSPGPYSPSHATNNMHRAPSLTERRSGEIPRMKPSKSTTKLVVLWPNCLADDAPILVEVEVARNRIVTGLCAARVITGQGRWGIWRDEAIWASRWAAGLEQRMFFCNLLTGFLATHTDWLQALCPPAYRRRLFLARRHGNEEDLSLPARTVIVSDDKMAARRLTFLLSAFLPANQQLPGTRTHRPSTSTSLGTFSNSPPTYVIPILREESLRRKINRRTGPRRTSHSRTTSQSTRASAVPAQLAHLSIERTHERRVSDAASIRTANLTLSNTGSDLVSRKSSAATTTTIVPEPTTPHFSTLQRVESRRRPRPGSSGSVAADDLKRSLQRGESSGQLSTTSSVSRIHGLKWGNLMTGLWSPRRRDSNEQGDYGHGGELRSPIQTSFGRADKLSDMVREVSVAEEDESGSEAHVPAPPTNARDVTTPRDKVDRGREPFPPLDRTPDPSGAFESPVKTSINADDGVIDVDITFPDYITSLESAISSPSSSGYLSTPGYPGGFDSFEHSARTYVDGDVPLNAAGWLPRFHPDFAIQAIPPQESLLEEIKASLRAEPTPVSLLPLGNDAVERWVDVGSVVIADTRTGSITRVLYRRLVKPRLVDRSSNGNAPLTPSILPYENQLDEEWIEDSILSPDDGLAEAIEKVVGISSESGRETHVNSSQATSETRPSTDSRTKMQESPPNTHQPPPLLQDAPRVQCRTVVLSALEDAIRDVIEHRESVKQSYTDGGCPCRVSQNWLRDAVRDWVSNLEATD
ncbi:folliculin-interacting protein N-terminus-domain-containing protein [Stachybotrys elegans]|uniref:Folliculin-interacting protein N-terminus-domain-containing protein n=1 Tax=Stachybotrys elegans TaxID=80388 RepID=A0A8K0T733_9HYPO|nr:folliculin-interacting protein N-terminus-domain-containing protein [Stachybotrys elegans]